VCALSHVSPCPQRSGSSVGAVSHIAKNDGLGCCDWQILKPVLAEVDEEFVGKIEIVQVMPNKIARVSQDRKPVESG